MPGWSGHRGRRAVAGAGGDVDATSPNIMLMHLDNDTTDERGHTTTPTDMTYDPTIKVFGSHAGIFNGSTSCIKVTHAADLDVLDNDFVLEGWIRFNSLATNQGIYCARNATNGLFFDFLPGNGLSCQMYRGSFDPIFTAIQGSDSGWAVDTWYHIAAVRSANTLRVFRAGVLIAAGGNPSPPAVPSYSGSVTIGCRTTGDLVTREFFFNGRKDEIGITIGSDKGWSGGFIPDTAPYV